MSDFYTVSQYAKTYNKDPGNIRRMLIKGTLKGEKIGNEWAIPVDVAPPEDRRVKNGNYRNWRQKIKLNAKHPEMIKSLNDMCDRVAGIYAGKIAEIILYGSYARGQETAESDIDMAFIFRDRQTEEQYEQMTELVVDYELDMGVTLSIVPIDQKEFNEWRTTIPFYENVDKEGIVLWKSA